MLLSIYAGGESEGDRVVRFLLRPVRLRDLDLDLLELGERLRFLISAGDPEPTSEGERLRRLTGVTDRELLELARRRRGGVRDRDLDSLGAGELGLS